MNINVNLRNWRTTLAGVLGATINILVAYLQGQLDTKTFIISAVMAILGYFAKDATTGSKPGTPSP